MIIAVRANLKRVFQLLFVQMRAALVATHKNIFSADDALFIAHRLDLAFLFPKPGHMKAKSEFRTRIHNETQGSNRKTEVKRVAQRKRLQEPGALAPRSRRS